MEVARDMMTLAGRASDSAFDADAPQFSSIPSVPFRLPDGTEVSFAASCLFAKQNHGKKSTRTLHDVSLAAPRFERKMICLKERTPLETRLTEPRSKRVQVQHRGVKKLAGRRQHLREKSFFCGKRKQGRKKIKKVKSFLYKLCLYLPHDEIWDSAVNFSFDVVE